MDILFFAEASPYLDRRVGGAETSIRLIAESLARRGHSVTLASLKPDGRPGVRRERRDGVELLLLPNPRARLRLLGRLGLGESAAARALARRLWDRVGDALFAGRWPDILYAFYEIELLERALGARADSAMRIVMRMAGLNWYEAIRRDPARRDAIAAIFDGVDSINYLSEASRDLVASRAAELGLDFRPRASLVADIGVETGRVPARWRGPSPGPGLDLVVATRFSAHQKRQDVLVEAVALLKGRLDVRVTMIGNGATRAAIERRRDALGLTGAIEIVPFLPQEALWARLADADLLCHPCDYEGLGKIILEAMMLGLPVLVSDVPPLSAYVRDGETGFRVPNDPEAWAAKLLAIAGARERLPAVSARARAFVERHYDVERNVDLYEAHFRALLEG